MSFGLKSTTRSFQTSYLSVGTNGGITPSFRERDGSIRQMKVSGSVHANSGRFLEALAVEGSGIAYEPDFIAGPDIRAGRLVPILLAFQLPPSTIQLVYPSRRHLSAKVRAFVDFLRERFATAEWTLKPAGGAGERRPRR